MTTTTQFTNNASTTLASAITASATSIAVSTGTGALFPILTTGQYFYGTLASASTTTTEIVQVTAVSTDTFTVVRGYSGTTAAAFSSGDKFELRITATSAANWEAKVEATALTSAISAIPTNGRQTVQLGVVGTTGYANMLSAGTGLAVNLAATAQPMRTAFAQGASDFITTLSTDVASIVTIPASNLSFVTADYVSSSSVTWGSTLAPRQEGYAYNQAAQSALSLNNISTDDFGNSWTNTAVTFSNTSPAITGTYMGVFNGTTSYIRSTAITSAGPGSWTTRLKIKPTVVTGTNYLLSFPASGNTSYGTLIGIVSGKLELWLSSSGSFDITNGLVGSVTLTANTIYDIELTYDSIAGKYFVYINGVADSALTVTSSLKVGAWAYALIGNYNSTSFYTGSVQGFELLPYCVHPNGVSFTPSTALANVATQGYASDFYSSPLTTMYQVSAASTVAGNNPSFIVKNRVYVGEATGGASAVASVVSYALKGVYYTRTSGVQANSTRVLYSHNIGNSRLKLTGNIICKTAENGYVPGTVVSAACMTSNGSWTNTFNALQGMDRNTASFITGNNSLAMPNPPSAVSGYSVINIANWDTEIIIERLV